MLMNLECPETLTELKKVLKVLELLVTELKPKLN